MRIARDGTGLLPAARALVTQVKPTFMAPALAASVYGGLLAVVIAADGPVGTDALRGVATLPATLHLLAVFLALYAAHAKDSLVDFYGRDEDETLALTRAGCRVAIGASGVGVLACLGALGATAGPTAFLLTLPLWPLGYLHAPWLDRHPAGTSADYAIGVGLVVVGGYAVQGGRLDAVALGVAATFVPAVSAGAVLVDAGDVAVDRRLGKRTVPVLLGPRRAGFVAAGLLGASAAVVLALVGTGVLPPAAVAAAAVLGAVALATPFVDPSRGFGLAMAGTTAAAVLLLLSIAGGSW